MAEAYEAVQKKNLFSNFEQYGLNAKFLDSFIADLTNAPLRKSQLFDGIVCDPPYGVREGPKVLGYRLGKVAQEVLIDGTPAHLSVSCGHVEVSILTFLIGAKASSLLSDHMRSITCYRTSLTFLLTCLLKEVGWQCGCQQLTMKMWTSRLQTIRAWCLDQPVSRSSTNVIKPLNLKIN